jgi:hypothetical protein
MFRSTSRRRAQAYLPLVGLLFVLAACVAVWYWQEISQLLSPAPAKEPAPIADPPKADTKAGNKEARVLDTIKAHKGEVVRDAKREGKPVIKVVVSSSEADDSVAADLLIFPELRELDMRFTGLSNDGLKQIAKMKKLETLLVSGCNNLSDEGLEVLSDMPRLRTLAVNGIFYYNDGIERLGRVKTLESLDIGYTQIDDDALKAIGRLANLRDLNVSFTSIGDEGLKHLARLDKLETLNLTKTEVTDAGLLALQGLKNLRELHLFNTDVTADGVARLQKALPKCKIER